MWLQLLLIIEEVYLKISDIWRFQIYNCKASMDCLKRQCKVAGIKLKVKIAAVVDKNCCKIAGKNCCKIADI